VSSIKRDGTGPGQSLCDNFLYGVKGGLATANRRPAGAEDEAAGDARETPVDARGCVRSWGYHRGESYSARGRQSRGAALASPPPLRGGATGAAASRPVCRPEQARGWSPPSRTRGAGSARTANVLDHQDEAGQSAQSPGEDQEQTLAARRRVRGTSPLTLRSTVEVSENLSRALRVLRMAYGHT